MKAPLAYIDAEFDASKAALACVKAPYAYTFIEVAKLYAFAAAP